MIVLWNYYYGTTSLQKSLLFKTRESVKTQLPPSRWGSSKHFFYLNQCGLVEREERRSVLAEGIT